MEHDNEDYTNQPSASDAEVASARNKKRKSGPCCAVARCQNYVGNTNSPTDISFHSFPRDPALKTRWTHLCKRQDKINADTAKICSSHFISADYVTNDSRKRLRPDVVPSVFDCLPQHSKPASSAEKQRLSPFKRHLFPTSPKVRKESNAKTVQTEMSSDHFKRLQERITQLEKNNEELEIVVAEWQKKAATSEDNRRETQNAHFGQLVELRGEIEVQKIALLEATRVNKELEEKLTRQEFRAEKFAECDTAVNNLTGLPNYQLLKNIYDTFVSRGSDEFLDTIALRKPSSDHYPRRTPQQRSRMSLDYFNQYFLTLVKLRTGMTDDVIGAIFGIPRATAGIYFNCWIRVLDEVFRNLFALWPERNGTPVELPPQVSALFPRIDLIVDCFEIRTQTPKNPDVARRCWSQYKHSSTIKVLVGVEMDGNAAFISRAFHGSISDIEIVRRSGLFACLKAGDVVLADRGFQLGDHAKNVGVIWVVPPSAKGNRGFEAAEMCETYRIARIRILVERWIGRLKKWRKFDGPLMIHELDTIDKEINVVASLCKFLPPLTALSQDVQSNGLENADFLLNPEEEMLFTANLFLAAAENT